MDKKPNTPKRNRNAAKRYIIITAAVVAILLILLSLLAYILSRIADGEREVPELDYDFYDMVEDLDINDYPEYLIKDRTLYYTNEVNMKKAVDEKTLATIGDGPAFFYDYIEAIKAGDAKKYNSFFDEEYLDYHGEKEDFTKQMLYDINLRYVKETEINNDIDAVTYALEYCIYRNNGSFRRDIGSGYRTQYITLYFDLKNGDIKIHSLQTEYNIVK